MVFKELNRVKNGRRTTIRLHTKLESRRLRRAKQRQADRETQLKARSLQSTTSNNIQNNLIKKVDLEPSAC